MFDVTYYYNYDGLGSVTEIIDSVGTIVQSYEYDTFGNIVSQTGSIENPYAYTGREWDEKAGLYFYRARYYDPSIGRFVTNDPIGFSGGDVNFYVYVQNNPVNWIDPFGLITPDRIPGFGTSSLSSDYQLFRDAHYKRNGYNRDVDYETAKKTWDSSVDPRLHRQGCGNEKNVKYVSPDGSSEAIFDSKHNPVNDPLNRGTYNFSDPRKSFGLIPSPGHIIKDMIPYYLWGNSPDDPSNFYDRIRATF